MSVLLREPVRAAFGTLLLAVLGLLVALDVIDDATSIAIGAAVSAAGVVLAELARAQVTPVVVLTPPVPANPDEGASNLELFLTIVAGIVVGLLLWALIGDDLRD